MKQIFPSKIWTRNYLAKSYLPKFWRKYGRSVFFPFRLVDGIKKLAINRSGELAKDPAMPDNKLCIENEEVEGSGQDALT